MGCRYDKMVVLAYNCTYYLQIPASILKTKNGWDISQHSSREYTIHCTAGLGPEPDQLNHTAHSLYPEM
jgi:hypothetical protein